MCYASPVSSLISSNLLQPTRLQIHNPSTPFPLTFQPAMSMAPPTARPPPPHANHTLHFLGSLAANLNFTCRSIII